MTIAEQILEALKQNSNLSTKDLVTALSVSPRTINHNIATLIADGKVSKTGKHPEIKYCLAPTGQTAQPQAQTQLPPSQPVPEAKPTRPKAAVAQTISEEPTFGALLCKRLGLDPLTVQVKHDKIHDWALGGYTLKSKRATSKPPNLMLRLVGGVYELAVWALALLAVFVGKMIKPKAPALAEAGATAKVKGNPLVWIMVITFLTGGVIGGIIGSTIHKASKKQASLYKAKEENQTLREQLQAETQNFVSLQNEFNQSKEQLAQSEEKVNNLQQKVDQVDNQNRDLQDQLTQTKEQLQVETRHASSLQDELNMAKDQSARDRAEIERLNDKGGQLNSTVPISYIPMNQIVAWTSQGVPSDEIINRIKSSHSAYWLTASDLTWLRQHAVNEEVIQVMANSGPLRDNASPQSQSHPVKNILGWVQDKLNGQ